MKKVYLTPAANVINIENETILAGSYNGLTPKNGNKWNFDVNDDETDEDDYVY